MLHLMPTHVPALPDLLADLGNPPVVEVARRLDVSARTVFRWLEHNDAPLTARLALFWITAYGWSAHESDARRKLHDWRALAEARRVEIEALQERFERFARIADFGSANGPDWRNGLPLMPPASDGPAPAMVEDHLHRDHQKQRQAEGARV